MSSTRDIGSVVITVALVFALLTAMGAPVAATVVSERSDGIDPASERGVVAQQSATETTNETTSQSSTETTETNAPSTSAPTTEPATPTTTPPTATPAETTSAETTSDGQASGDTSFVVSNLSTQSTVRRGDRIDVAATVTNRGTGTGTELVNYTFGGTVVATEQVTLDAGESTRVSFTSSLAAVEQRGGSAAPGSYVHGVQNETGHGAAARVRVTPDVDFTMRTFDAPTELSHSEPYIVLATVENPGQTTITRTVSYEFDGYEIAEKTVTVGAGKQRQVAFEVSLADVEETVGSVRNETTHNHAVVTGESRRGGEMRVVEGPSADASTLAVERFEVANDVRPGEPVRVNMTVRNVGSSDFKGQLSYRLDDAIVATEWVRVPIGEKRTVQFELSYDQVERAAIPVSSQETTHGVWVGDDALETRPVTVYAPVETETETPPPATFTPAGESPPDDGDTDADNDGESTCQRGFFSECGGTSMDETTLTLIGIATSVFGIAYEMLKSR
ncbi:hypothetical protein AUR64_02785 [Haloprofundus marisrubri]|uniref:CARDB domain-containing protein n=1 Tax=Haloprofundus marisrubri TaxID=1514971 RepID=A0A0W1R330_9EURY|nr:hypothetical protein [Haloprofundus marisrubri]KTG07780.1 hypothetical protein AUR64_02785 [Haloprofundus marisrubri]